MMTQFKIDLTIDEDNKHFLTVSRKDGKVIKDMIVEYNFELEDWLKAADCANSLEKEFEQE